MLQDHALQQAADYALSLFIEAADGFELQPEVVIGAALVFAEKEHIRTDLQSGGEFANHVKSRLGSAGLLTP